MSKQIFILETVSMFRHQYAIEANSSEEIEKNYENIIRTIEEFSQEHITESAFSLKRVSTEEYIKAFDESSEGKYRVNYLENAKMKFINNLEEHVCD